ncbi:MAG: 50S ribosomal protein L4 [Armatimonadota bacterium]|nr:50S ribosomal protein L4 [Armatimonadota bacterium]MDR7423000.1 50S ribosomal protein L4 [Armatimonadota bacterium]MDR7453970.1 50S ribosomal protein L4 [Armatimonadota bacterium]MDR7497665.1 50S ribosomal protein L4 [Armatimonadota bacterium]MDR7512846.1 50S ribosomal protein L4 [Armatimonadota bacterium]
MPKATAYHASGAPAGEVELPEAIFGLRPHRPVLHQAVVTELANRRQGTHATKTRGDVRGGGRKPWRQKGTGRARHGSRRSPLWSGGGITFGPQPREHGRRMSRRERALAIRSALSAHAQQGTVVVIEAPAAPALKTKAVAGLLRAAGAGDRAVVVAGAAEAAFVRAAANLAGARVLAARRLSVRHLLVPGTLVLTRGGLAELQEALAS